MGQVEGCSYMGLHRGLSQLFPANDLRKPTMQRASKRAKEYKIIQAFLNEHKMQQNNEREAKQVGERGLRRAGSERAKRSAEVAA
eukprot:2394917-Amphidinium_carterae.1